MTRQKVIELINAGLFKDKIELSMCQGSSMESSLDSLMKLMVSYLVFIYL
ncbi:MAG: hypothetical protein H6Q69_139 [Firmicutes bacterium]|nr:hypothetical protein [Bacillota bacterium]MBP2657107.1 hypothetical protein [Bacillota bacterium]